jgi:hypothetical protein
METLKEALERNGFEYIGPCKICGGRGFEYKLNRTVAKIKKDMNGRELKITFSGWTQQGRRIVPTQIELKIEAHRDNLDSLIQKISGLNDNSTATEQ